MVKHVEEYGAKALDEVRKETPGSRRDVPGPTPNPASNLIMADIAMRTGTYVLRGAVEKGLLRGRYGKDAASEMVENRSLAKSLTGFALAKLATRSLPGAVVVGSGMLAKTLFDRGKSRRARLKGDRELMKQASDD